MEYVRIVDTYTVFRTTLPASVGLAQARPNNLQSYSYGFDHHTVVVYITSDGAFVICRGVCMLIVLDLG